MDEKTSDPNFTPTGVNPESTAEAPPHESKKARALRRNPTRKIGRPRNPNLERRFQVEPGQRELVQTMVGYAVPLKMIAQCIRNPHTRRPVAVSTLTARFANEIERGRAAAVGMLCTALTHKIRNGDTACIIFAAKNMLGWTDRREVQAFGEVDLNVKITREQLAQELEKRGLPGTVFGIDKPVLDLAPLANLPPPINGRK
jgi:hypothetical protein